MRTQARHTILREVDMTRLPGIFAFILLSITILPLTAGQAQWIEDGIELCTESYTQHGSRAVNDGADGAIVAWLDFRSGASYDIYAQRLDRYGNELWTAGGLGIVTMPLSQKQRSSARRRLDKDECEGMCGL